MKKKRAQSSVSLASKACLVKKCARGISKSVKRTAKLRVKTKDSSSLNLVRVASSRVNKKKKKGDAVFFSSENFPPPCSTETAGPSHLPQTSLVPLVVESPNHSESSYAPLIIDSPGNTCGPPAFSITDASFETPEGEVSMLRMKKRKQTKRKRSTSSTSISRQHKEIQLFPVREWGILIAVLPHPTCIQFVGPILIQVFSGSVKILGHVMEPSHGIVQAFSSSKLMSLGIKTESTKNICRQASLLQNVKNVLLQNRISENMADKILDSCDNSSVIVGFRKNFRSSDVHFACSLMPNVVSGLKKKKNKNDFGSTNFQILGSQISSENSATMEFPECRDFIHDVISSIKVSDVNESPAPRIVVQGNKGLGKSTLLRYSINRILNEFDAVYYLDGDPGQSEFVPAGCVSLVKVTAPLLGPPFTHQTTPEKMYFLGTVAIQDVPYKYSQCVRLLVDYYKENCSSIPLFVNTMGWGIGMGLTLLEELKSYVIPTHVVKIVDDQLKGSRSKATPPTAPGYSAAKEFTYQRFAPVDEAKQLMHPADRRDLSILTYLGKCQKPYNPVCSFNSITPYCIQWKDLALYIADQKHATEHILYAFNASWVALLSVDESLIMDCDDPALPKLLSADPVEQECYGFGVIRGIDLAKKAFYIITPEPKDRLKKVNAIMKAEVHLPTVLFTSQVTDKQIPYVARVTGESSVASKHIKRRKFRPNKSEMQNQ